MELTGAARPSGSGVLRQGSRRFVHVAPEVQENDDGKQPCQNRSGRHVEPDSI